MGRITTDQSHSVMAVLGTNTAWAEIDFEGAGLQDAVLRAPKEAGHRFTEFLKNGCRLVLIVRPGSWPVWRKLIIGGKSAAELLEALKAAGCKVYDWARDIIGKETFTTLPAPTEIALARAKVRDLGFNDPNNLPTTLEVFARAQELGLYPCPAETGPHLRLALKDQPKGDAFWVAMEPIVGSGGHPVIFGVKHDENDLWLDASYTHPEGQWSLGREIVFSLGKPQ